MFIKKINILLILIFLIFNIYYIINIMSDFGYTSALANQTSMTSAVLRGNQQSSIQRDQMIKELKDNLATNNKTLDDRISSDKLTGSLKDGYAIGSDLQLGYSAYQDYAKAGSFVKYMQGAGAGDRLQSIGKGLGYGVDSIREAAITTGKAIAPALSGATKAGSLGVGVAGVVKAKTDAPAPLKPVINNKSTTFTTPLKEEANLRISQQSAIGISQRTPVSQIVASREASAKIANNVTAPSAANPEPSTQSTPVKNMRLSQTIEPEPEPEALAVSTKQQQANPESIQPKDTITTKSSGAGSAAPSAAGEDVSETLGKGINATDQLSSKISTGIDDARRVAGLASTANKIVSSGMGITTGVLDVMSLTDGDYGKMSGLQKASDITGIVTGALDVASMFLPFLAPIAAASAAVGAVESGIGEVDSLINQKTTDKTDTTTSIDTLKNTKSVSVSPVITAGGLIASRNLDNTHTIAPTSTF